MGWYNKNERKSNKWGHIISRFLFKPLCVRLHSSYYEKVKATNEVLPKNEVV